MKRIFTIVAAVVIIAAVGAGAFFFYPAGLEEVTASGAQPTGQALIERGRYLATAGDCVACHSIAGGGAYAGGLAFKLPFGTIYSSNITPDKETGIGDWSDAEFVRAMKHGVGKHGEDLYPAFPYTSYALLKTDDILAIKAFLFTVPPVHTATAANSLSFPFNQRYLMRAWKLLFLPKDVYQPQENQSEEWNHGAYLVEALGHCGECHTPRNLLYGLDSGKKFAGAITQGWKAYNITSENDGGIGGWSVEDLNAYLHTGHADGHGTATGSMAEAIDLSLRHLSEQDVRSMAVYLKSIAPQPTSAGLVDPHPPLLAASQRYAPSPTESAQPSLGLTLFQGACASCHAWNGEGQQTPHASLLGSHTANDPDGTNLVQVILHGSNMMTSSGDALMPAFADAYSDTEIAALSNYVLSHFGNKAGSVTPKDVAAARRVAE